MHATLRRGRLLAAASALSVLAGLRTYAQDRPPEPPHDETEVEEVVAQATRSGRRLKDEPIKVEVVSQEEVEEKVLMTPGNISTLVAETGGVRMQVTSPALGAAAIRIQGMRGRYTQLLSDGLPLFGGQSSSLGVLQIPPSDLGRVEVIKGAASALYGPSALGGVINLVSRRPRPGAEGEVLLNGTSRNGQDLTGYAAAPGKSGWGYSLTGGLHRQSAHDLDGDGWRDISEYDRWLLRPRLFWEGEGGGKLYATAGVMEEKRQGGTAPGRTAPDGLPFIQAQDTSRHDAGFVAETPLADIGVIHLRASGVNQRHDHQYGAVVEKDRHQTLFAELSLAGGPPRTPWLVGAAIQQDVYRNGALPVFDYTHATPALFGQVEHDVTGKLVLAGSVRSDWHSVYGTHVSPRISLLFRDGPWSLRGSVGQGFYAPTPFVEEIEATGLSRLDPGVLKAETARTASLEGGYRAGRIELDLTLFGSEIRNTVRLEVSDPTPGAERVQLVNDPGVSRTAGAEMLVRYRWKELTVTGSYVYLDATEPEPAGPGRRTVPVTPRHTAGMVAMWENYDKGRIGLEVYYTGRQSLEDNPYRTSSRPYVEVGLLAEKVIGKGRVFVNLENILDVRQTKYDPLLLPVRAPSGQWTVDAWAPAEGFVANAGFKLRFGGG